MKNHIKIKLVAMATVSTLAAAFASEPKVIFEEDFERYDAPSAPIQDEAPNDSSISGWKLLGFGDRDVVTNVVERNSTDGFGGNNRVLHLQSPISPRLAVWNLFEPVQASDKLNKIEARFKFSISPDLQEPSDMVFGLIEDESRPATTTSYLGAIRIRYEMGGTSRFYYYEGEEENRVAVGLPLDIHPDMWYEVVLSLDLGAKTWGFSIQNLDASESPVSREGLALREDASTIAGFGMINRTPPAALNHFFDDIRVQTKD